MKNYMKSFICAVALTATVAFAASANDKEVKAKSFGTGIYTTRSGKINIMVDKYNGNSSTVILLKNEAGDEIYQEVVGKNKQKFCRILNVDELESGKYELQIISNKEIQSKHFELNAPAVERLVTLN